MLARIKENCGKEPFGGIISKLSLNMETTWSQWTFQHNTYIEIGLGVEAGWRSK